MHYVTPWLSCLILGGCFTPFLALAEPVVKPSELPQLIRYKTPPLDFSQHFEDFDVEGSILVYDLHLDQTHQHNPERNRTEFRPASTFKILNSLIALDTGAIANDLAILTWDGVERSYATWNRDLNMREAFQISAVWFYQVLARRAGHQKMQELVAAANYGNQNIGQAADLDTFWLTGDLRITPEQQIEFLQRLYRNESPFFRNESPFSEQAIATVKDIMIVEQTPDYTIRAKTGWADAEDGGIGWYVGYLERDEKVYFFATNLDIRKPEDLAARIKITRRCLRNLGLL